ncbi:hypothetical protein ONS96_008259 [Cadophora gregata f. sp. sojae]|nr:hypothetical protein ONS96_008259 [Cadophora gregata f. sp. sojae]
MSTTFRLTFLYPPSLFRPCSTRTFASSTRKIHSRARPRARVRIPQLRCLFSERCFSLGSSFGGRTRAGARVGTGIANTNGNGNGSGSVLGLRRNFSTTQRRGERVLKRHGKAVEPLVAEEQREKEILDGAKTPKPEERTSTDGKGMGGVTEGSAKEVEEENPKEKDVAKEPSSAAPLSEETQAAAKIPGDEGARIVVATATGTNTGNEQSGNGKQETATPTNPSTSSTATTASTTATPANPLETVLHMPPPETAEEENASKPPHLQTPPYVHHFDTYTLVQQVEAGGFTNDQAITSMKAVRGLLALNLDVAKKGLVSKSDVENVRFFLYVQSPFFRRKNAVQLDRDRLLIACENRKHTSSAPHAQNSKPRSKIHARRTRKPCVGNGHCYNMKWIS